MADVGKAMVPHKRANTIDVTSPTLGYTFGLDDGDAIMLIEWEVPPAIADEPVLIQLVQGLNESSLTYVDIVNSTAPNNGSYTWRAGSYNALYCDKLHRGAPSGCNYSISIQGPQAAGFSPYFTIMNPFDSGLPTNVTCPQFGDITQPENGKPTGTSEQSNTVSQSTLIVAVVVPIVALLLGFGVLLWFIIKRGWLVRAHSAQNEHLMATNVKDPYNDHVASHDTKAWDRCVATDSPAQLDGRDVPHRAAGNEIYQLHGDDNGRVNH
ncbi:hypothetical protein LTR17_027021 [Elasticomyces elasticus]|nr:hypothetical protein LTR17_027021 [Elasticomyces elasticus]